VIIRDHFQAISVASGVEVESLRTQVSLIQMSKHPPVAGTRPSSMGI
jgi:hypothetical protein